MTTENAPSVRGLDALRQKSRDVRFGRGQWAIAGTTAVAAAGLWVGSGVINRVLLWNLDSVPYQLINLVVPPALDFNLRPGEYQVSTLSVFCAVLVAIVVGAITHLAARVLPAATGRLPLFLAAWFAAVVASSVGSTLQVVTAFMGGGNPAVWGAAVNGLIPYITGGGWWGLALGWVVGLAAVLTHRRVNRPAPPT